MHSYVNHKNLKKALLTNYLSKMKKGLLSLLAVALTVVGCQNYDDQFDELSDQITALSSTVQGLSSVADQITALQNTVNGLELTSRCKDIATIKTAVDALTASLADVATAADLGSIIFDFS